MPRKWKNRLLAGALLLLLAAMPAAAGTLADIQRNYTAHPQFVVPFTQTTYQAMVKREVVFNGTVAYKRDAGVRMDVKSPERQLIILRQDTVWIHLLDEGTCSVQQIPREFASQNILSFFAGMGSLEGDYHLTRKDDHLELSPKGGSGTIQVWTDADNLLNRIRLQDATGNHSDLRLGHYDFDVDLPDKLFVPPDCGPDLDTRVNTP